jgi:uncharacterized protein YukE
MAAFNNVHADTDAIGAFAQLSEQRVAELRALMSALEGDISSVVNSAWQGPAAQAAAGAGERCIQSLQVAQTAIEDTNVTKVVSFNNAQVALEETAGSGLGKLFL